MLDQGNAQLSAVGFYNPTMGQRPLDEFFGGASAADGALPYEVRWDAELDGGDGGWKIFLPTSHLLSYNGVDVAPTGVTAIADGWHSLDDVQRSSTHVWLVLSVVDSTGVCTAEFSPTQGQSVTGTTVYNICVAEVSYAASAAEGDQPTVAVKQSLVGALHLGSGGGSTPTPSTAIPQSFDIEGGYVVRCRIFAPIAEVTCSDYAINTSGGDIYVHLDRSTNGYTLSVDQTSRQNSATHAQWRLYAYSDGAPTLDLRPRILPVFELVS